MLGLPREAKLFGGKAVGTSYHVPAGARRLVMGLYPESTGQRRVEQ